MDTLKNSPRCQSLGLNNFRYSFFIKAIGIILSIFVFVGSAYAAPAINTLDKTSLFGKHKPSGVAIKGYDPVAYFTLGKPVEGSKQFKVEWMNSTWLFSSAEHKDLFEASPEKYAPQYGGYCAYGVSQDYLVKIEPDQWSIIDDKLYLNYDMKVQKLWSKDIEGFIESANGKFEKLLAAD